MSQQLPASAFRDPAFLQLPALEPPPGVIPNFADPENKGPTLIVVGAILLALVIIALVNRAYTKLIIVRKISWDDLTVSLSALGAIATYISCILEVQEGIIGRHQYEIRLGDFVNHHFLIANYIILTLNGPTLWIIRLTFFLLYLQIFRPMRWLRLCIYFGAALSTVFYWSLSVAIFVLASPRSGETWAEVNFEPQAAKLTKVNVAVAAGGLLVDIWLLVLPLAGIYKLQLHRTRKVGLSIMFSSGLIAVAASTLSIYFRYQLQHIDDKIWAGLNMETIYLIEVDLGIITACMPSFARMMHHHLPPWKSLKERLNLDKSASPIESPKEDLLMILKRSKQTDFDEIEHCRGDKLYSDCANSSAGIELESLKSLENHV